MLINRRGLYQACRSFSLSFLLIACALVASAAVSARAATVNVPAGGDLQAALNSAQPGDTIVLQAGATYVGPITLPVKSGSSYITIQSSALAALPPDGQRVSPAFAPLMPKIVSPGLNEPALHTAPAAHHFQFIGIEFAKQTPDVQVGDLIMLGDGTSAQNSLALVPHHLTFDRCYMHGEPTTPLKRGIALNSAETSIINSYLSDFKNVGQDTQAICGWNGPGPFHIINNYLEGAGENIMFGGAAGYIQGVNPADIEIRRNYIYKPPAWRGVWLAKNLLELKRAERVVIDGNVLENSWQDGQEGFALMFSVRNDDGLVPWATLRDVTFTNNIVRHAASGLHVLNEDNNAPSQRGANITIRNNVFEDINGPAYGGRGAFLLYTSSVNLDVEHNTVVQTGFMALGYFSDFPQLGGGAVHGYTNDGFTFSNNIVWKNDYGFFGDGTGEGTIALTTYAPTGQFARKKSEEHTSEL